MERRPPAAARLPFVRLPACANGGRDMRDGKTAAKNVTAVFKRKKTLKPQHKTETTKRSNGRFRRACRSP